MTILGEPLNDARDRAIGVAVRNHGVSARFASTASPTSIVVCWPSVSRSNTSILSGADSFCRTNMRSTASLVSGKSAPRRQRQQGAQVKRDAHQFANATGPPCTVYEIFALLVPDGARKLQLLIQ